MQDHKKSLLFLREIREMVFLQKKNITKWENIKLAAEKAGLDVLKFKSDYEGSATAIFEEDLKLGRSLGVRGFPTMFFTDSSGHQEIVYGSKPYSAYENALLKLLPSAVKTAYNTNWDSVFSKYSSLTAKEFSVLTGIERNESEKVLGSLTVNGKLNKLTTKNGDIWQLKDN